MSKKNATVAAVEAPKPVEIPNPYNHPDVVRVRDHHDTLNARLSVIRQERKSLERDLGAKPGESDDALESRLLARGRPTDDLTRLRELRRSEQVTAKAVELVAAEVKAAHDHATRELTAAVREQVFLPGVRAAVKDWLDAVQKAETFRALVDDIQGRGVGSGTYCPFNGRVPLTLDDRDGFTGFVAELIREGFTDRDTVNAALPGVL